ncbi:MAG: lysophospholipid acyltransferase family protein [Planctomycetota bacterium]
MAVKPPKRCVAFLPLYRTFRLGLRFVFWLYWKWRRIGMERMPSAGPVLIAGNHASFLDPTILGSAYERPVSYMARRSLFEIFFFGWLIGKVNAFPVDREGDPRSALRAVGERLARGECVALFPEGTRTQNGRLGRIKRGVGMIAVRSGAVVLPTYIHGAYESWPRSGGLRFHPLRVEAGEPIVPRPCGEDRQAARAEADRIQAEVERQLLELEHRAFLACGKGFLLAGAESAGETESD